MSYKPVNRSRKAVSMEYPERRERIAAGRFAGARYINQLRETAALTAGVARIAARRPPPERTAKGGPSLLADRTPDVSSARNSGRKEDASPLAWPHPSKI